MHALRNWLRRTLRGRFSPAARPLPSRCCLPLSLRWQLLITVNGVLAILVMVFLLIDYRRGVHSRLEQQRVALLEEARTIVPALGNLRHHGPAVMQAYLDAVCGQMHDAQSPGHHIAARVGAAVFQAAAHGRSSPARLRAMQLATSRPDHAVRLGREHLLVGTAGTADVVVYVTEDVTALHEAALGQTLWRLGGVLSLGLVAAGLVSEVLLRAVARPIDNLVAATTAIARGEFGTQFCQANSREVAALASAMQQMSQQLQATAAQRQGEMNKAREIQEHLLPKPRAVPGMRVAALYRPATDVAGDYYDLLPLPDGSWLLCIADVCGHGVPAAMSAAMLKALLTHAIEGHREPDALLRFVNARFIALSPPEVFASMLLARWDPQSGTLQHASAGHEPAWLVRSDGSSVALEATGFLLGIDSESTWDAEDHAVGPGDCLVSTTDGVPEALAADGQLFGRDRLRTWIREVHPERLEQWLVDFDEAIQEHQGGCAAADDTTILAVAFTTGAATEAQPAAAPMAAAVPGSP